MVKNMERELITTKLGMYTLESGPKIKKMEMVCFNMQVEQFMTANG